MEHWELATSPCILVSQITLLVSQITLLVSQITLLVSQITLLVSQITLLKPVFMDNVCGESADTVNYVMNIVISDQPYHPIVFLGFPGFSLVIGPVILS